MGEERRFVLVLMEHTTHVDFISTQSALFASMFNDPVILFALKNLPLPGCEQFVIRGKQIGHLFQCDVLGRTFPLTCLIVLVQTN